jgi:hypothetical protein
MAAMFAPSRAGDQRFCRWFARFQRTIASPRTVQVFLRANFEMDARPILPLIQAPTLVLHRRDYQFIPSSHGRYLAEHIPGATLVELEGTEQSLFWETPETGLGPRRAVPDRRPPRRPANPDAVDGAVHRHRRLHPAGRGAGRPALARAVERPRRADRPAGRGVRRPAGQDHRRRHPGHLRRPPTGDPLCGSAQARACSSPRA